jgi:hypothetical protein
VPKGSEVIGHDNHHMRITKPVTVMMDGIGLEKPFHATLSPHLVNKSRTAWICIFVPEITMYWIVAFLSGSAHPVFT